MRIRLLARCPSVEGRVLDAGQIVEATAEAAADLIRRGLAKPLRLEVERAVVVVGSVDARWR